MSGGCTPSPHFVPTALVRGYYISGHKAPQPVLRTIFHPRPGIFLRHKDIYNAYIQEPLRALPICLSTKLLTLGTAHASTDLHSLNRNSPLSLRAEEDKYTTLKEYVLMFLCLNKLPLCLYRRTL